MSKGGPDNADNSYWCIVRGAALKTDPVQQAYYNQALSYIIYGFKYIYQEYKKFVLPVEHTDKNDKTTLGTCFVYQHGIVTARHCVENAKQLSIQGFSKESLQSAKFEIHENPMMDLLFIRTPEQVQETIWQSHNADILDEVMTLGYPKIAGYHNFLTAENATVSSRFTTSTGQVASKAEDIWIKEKLFLITAKIKGGNSGGPVVNKQGAVIGVAVNLTIGEGDYDDLGYGTVIPISFVNDIIEKKTKNYLDTSNIEFKDFE